MDKCKFWLIQLVMVAFVSLILGSPVLADDDDDDGRKSHQQWNHGDDDDDDDKAFNDARWHKRWQAKLDKKTAKFNRKMERARSDARKERLEAKLANMQERFAAKLVRHELKYPEYHEITEPEPTESCVFIDQRVCSANGCVMVPFEVCTPL